VNGLVPEANWLLVAPWYRWGAQGVGTDGMTVRTTWPAFHKYAIPNPAGEFVKKPQHSLRFLESEDRYELPHALPPLGALLGLPGVRRRLSEIELVPTTIRKLYLDTHRRFYLVVVQLIQDQPGYPCVDRAKVCQQGFVVRRRSFTVDRSAIDREAVGILRAIVSERAQSQRMNQFIETLANPKNNAGGDATDRAPLSPHDLVTLAGANRQLKIALARDQRRMLAWAQGAGVGVQLEGWVPSPHKNIGSWQPLTDTPADLTEETYALYPLVADPDDTRHDGHDTSIYFGLVPTGGSDVEDDGTARFDDRSLYEIRCFVRRHDKRCPRTDHVPDCAGPLIWSAASESYRLAAQFDLTGTSNHAITVQAPDFPALAAKVAALARLRPSGQTGAAAVAAGGVRVVTPPNSSFSIGTTLPPGAGIPVTGALGSAGEICFFMIPFFTIIALFLVNLALPILMLIFGMGWLLALKLCIPPSAGADVSANLSLELAQLTAPTAAGGLGVDLSLSTSIDDQINNLTSPTTADANLKFRNDYLLPHLTAELGNGDAGHKMTDTYSTDALINLHHAMASMQEAMASRSLSARLQFEDDPKPVVRSQVVLV